MFDFHAGFSWFAVAANAVVGVWALASIRFRNLESRAMWVSVIIAQAAMVAQALAGVYLLTLGGLEVDRLHVFYGMLTVVMIGVGYVYAIGSEWVKERRALFYGVLSIFLMGLGIRAMLLTG